MKAAVRVLSIAAILALVMGILGSGAVFASARTANWVVSVTYQNVGTGPATIVVDFYPEGNGTPINFNPLGTGNTLAAGAGTSFFIGNVSGLPASFRGSAVMSSDQPLVATVVQFSNDAGFKMRMLSNGFQSTDGSNQVLVATALLNKFSRTTVFSIQNTESQDVKATVKLYDADHNGNMAASKDWVIPAGSSKYIEMDNAALTGLPSSTTTFNGSAIVTAVMNSDGTTAAKVVAAASEMYTNKNVAANFEGMPLSRASNTMNMATGLCQKFGLDSFYAVQNASLTTSAQISVKYYDTNGAEFANDPATGTYTIGPGQKQSITTCNAKPKAAGATMVGFTGSAVITSVGAPIVAIGKAQGSAGAGPATADVFTAFLGEPNGYSKLGLPFVRWANDANYNAATNMGSKQRTALAIQNLDGTSIKVNVQYFGKDGGSPLGTETLTIPPRAKANSSPSTAGVLGTTGENSGEFGYYTDGKFGGGVVIQADASNPNAHFIAISRVQNPGAGEDYNGLSVP